MNATAVARLRRELLAFYDERRRDLPWRRDADPYRVWVSEIMLQQTRVEAAIPYYQRWLARFPTLHSLADADTDDVLAAWEGLGYYSRARNLHKSARIVRDRLGGSLPDTADGLRALPGIGAYTAGAIASIAFGKAEPAIDGNVRRVLARLFDLDDPAPASVRARTRRLLSRERAGDFNQALMELGATVCVPRSPRCDECPIARWCLARARGTQRDRPRSRPAPAVPSIPFATVLLTDPKTRVLLQRRPDRGLLAGLWAFPATPLRDDGRATAAARRHATVLADGVRPGRGRRLFELAHAFSHRREIYHVYRYPLPRTPPRPRDDAFAWALPSELDRFVLPVAQRRIAERARIV